jgi:hypothetical protein
MSKNSKSFPSANWWERFVEAIGNWNPQLLHELNSRVSLTNLAICGLLSIGLQLASIACLLGWMHSTTNPSSSYHLKDYNIYNPTQWSSWRWGYAAGSDSCAIFVLMATLGVYVIASSFRKEASQGTLDFLRLSPRKTSTILIGKLLGSPILVYWVGICALPLQFYGAQVAQISLLTVLVWDLEILALLAIFYPIAALLTLRFKVLPILLAVSTCGLSILLILSSIMWSISSDSVHWYGISLSDPLMTFLAIAALVILVIYWLYLALERTYDRTATILSRKHSYVWSLNYHLFLLGLCITHSEYRHGSLGLSFNAALQTSQSMNSGHPIDGNLPGLFWSLLSFWLLSLIPLIQPSTQILSSWAKQKVEPSSWWKTMLFDDRSPAILAVLVNLGIAISVWTIPVLLMLPTIDTHDTAIEEGAYSVSSFGINFPSWLLTMFVLMFIANMMAPTGLFRRICNSPLWTIAAIAVILYPTISWTFLGRS